MNRQRPVHHDGHPNWPGRIVTLIRREVPLVLLDVAVVFVAYLIPLVLRFDGGVPSHYWRNFRIFIGAAALVHLLANYLFGLYAQMWRYASVQEARRVVLAGLTAGVFVVGTGLVFGHPRPLPLSVLAGGAGLSLFGFGAIRFQSRLFGFRRREVVEHTSRLLVVGAGEAGAMIAKDLLENPSLGLDPVAFVDDDPRKLRVSLRGVHVLGEIADIPALKARMDIDEVLFAMPSASGDVVRRVAALCEEADVPLRVLPSKHDIVSGRVTARDIRELSIEDLLGRGEVETDLAAVAAMLRGKRVLVTGAGGSIGSEIARQVARFEPAALLLLDHDETHLHDLRLDLPEDKAEIFLSDVRDRDRTWRLLSKARPDVVFHAAAHKHVPLLEAHPEEAVLTNVLGTANVADAAVAAGAERFVLISTDKGINPINVMGISKWFAERIVGSLRGNGTSFCSVRFGNVLGSRGSVIPTFIHQIARGGPVTVTDASMNRYFMSVQEAVQLVLQAASLAEGGEVFTLDMGEPVNILDLARKVIRLSGRVPERDVAIEIVGPRPGEKLDEEIADPSEELLESVHPAIRVVRPVDPDAVGLRAALHELESLARNGDSAKLAARMRGLVAESNANGHAASPQPEPASPEEARR